MWREGHGGAGLIVLQSPCCIDEYSWCFLGHGAAPADGIWRLCCLDQVKSHDLVAGEPLFRSGPNEWILFVPECCEDWWTDASSRQDHQGLKGPLGTHRFTTGMFQNLLLKDVTWWQRGAAACRAAEHCGRRWGCKLCRAAPDQCLLSYECCFVYFLAGS